jgi:hypothetical protein
MSSTASTGCDIHPVAANPFCHTCEDHGNPHPLARAEKSWELARAEQAWAPWHEAFEAAHPEAAGDAR